MKTLLDFAGRFDLTPDEFYLLGRLFFDQGKVAESVDYFAMAARPREGVNAEHLSALVRVYLVLNRLEPARQAVERLKATYPRSWEAARDEARVLHKTGLAAADKDEGRKLAEQAKQLVLNYPGAMTPEMIPNRTGPLLEELGFNTEAEAAYRRLLATSKSPGAHFPLAGFLIAQKRTAEAIELARQHDGPGTSVVLTARILSGAIRAKSPGPDAGKQVEAWLDAKLKEYAGKPEFPALVGSRAELLDAQARYPEAIAEYRRAVETGKSDLAVNNLCMLLALHQPEKADEALKLITDVIGVRGPSPVFLDTRAVVNLVKGRPEDAAKDLELALLQRRSPVYLFHLAWAHQLLNRPAFRETTLDEARKAGLTVEMIHPLELPKYRELLGPNAK
jgi:tetratricopeptide (TPR) repeat protein